MAELRSLFTPSVNSIPAPPGAVVGGLFAGRDLEPFATCVASNEGEVFYIPVPDPNSTINGNYTVKAEVARAVLPTLVHEFQHLINAGWRQFINNGPTAEELWLNEGLSHIAEELLYYRMSGNTPGSNIDLPLIQSSQAQIDAINTYQFDNLVRAALYMKAPETNSPALSVAGSPVVDGVVRDYGNRVVVETARGPLPLGNPPTGLRALNGDRV